VVHACMVDRRGGMCALTYLHDLHEALPCVGHELRAVKDHAPGAEGDVPHCCFEK